MGVDLRDSQRSIPGRDRPESVIFDLDDTLIDNHYKYLEADIAALRVVFRALGTQSPQPEEILRRAGEIDRRMVDSASPHQKFDLERFPKAWVETYEGFCRERGLKPRPEVREKVYSVACRAFRPPYPLVPYARSVLRCLKRRGLSLYLLTIGAESLQRLKIIRAGLDEFFREIMIVLYDKEQALMEVASRHGKESTMMVGNSLRSDINPALRIGIHAVLISRSTWDREKEPPVNRHFHRIESIRELPRLLETLG